MASVDYQCDRGVTVRATYINTSDDSIVIVSADGQDQIVLVNVVAASGARYGAPEGDAFKGLAPAPYEWWNKGLEAHLTHIGTDGAETALLSCVEAP